jgi:ring-1,2-phenylacetyl-CoA epoxidase subunit PaaE
MTFYPLTIKDLRRETADCVSIAFQVPPQYLAHFTFQQGQYLTLKTTLDGVEVRRSYSICSAPHEGELRVAIKEITDGVFSTFANRTLKIGDTLDVMPPNGHFFTPLSKEQQKHYVFFAAGSGITPVISNIKTILHTEPHSVCTLFYGNRRVASIIFKEEIEALKNQNLGRLQVFHVLSREKTDADLLYGRLNALKINQFYEKILRGMGDEFFSCGPIEMTEAVREVLEKNGVATECIHFELFNAPTSSERQKEVQQRAVAAVAHVKLDGLVVEVPIGKGENILDAALEAGMDLPFACKGGVCCTCRAKITEGGVEMAVNYALTKEEVTRGFVLTCQAVPKTTELVVDFDIK